MDDRVVDSANRALIMGHCVDELHIAKRRVALAIFAPTGERFATTRRCHNDEGSKRHGAASTAHQRRHYTKTNNVINGPAPIHAP